MLCKKGAFKHFSKLTGKHLCQSLFLNKVAGLRTQACNFVKKRGSGIGVFQWILWNFQGHTFSYRTLLVAASELAVNSLNFRQTHFNPFQVIISFLYPLKKLENERFSNVFKRLKREGWPGILVNKLTDFQPMFHFYSTWKHQKTSGYLIFSGVM